MKLSTDRIVSLIALFVGLGSHESVYGERWHVTSDKIVAERVE